MSILDDLLAGGWRQSVAVGTHELTYFIQGMDTLLANAAAEEKDWLEAATKAMEEGEREVFLVGHADALGKLTEDFPAFLWNSVTVMLFAYWERQYRDVAEWLLKTFHERRGVRHADPLQVRDFQGSWYEQSRKAVTQYAGIPDDKAHWSQLKALARIRNVIVHDSSQVKLESHSGRQVVADDKLRGAIQRWAASGVTVTDSGELRTSRRFVEAALSLIRGYMMDLLATAENQFKPPRPAG